jgi:FixJ family two-component response regulator
MGGGHGGYRLPNCKTGERPTVFVVDDDPSILRALGRLIRSTGIEARTFERPGLLLSAEIPKSNACLLLDVYLPGMNGVELYEALGASGRGLPVIMITGRDDRQTQDLVRRARAVAVLLKPFAEDVLLEAISRALALSCKVDVLH